MDMQPLLWVQVLFVVVVGKGCGFWRGEIKNLLYWLLIAMVFANRCQFGPNF